MTTGTCKCGHPQGRHARLAGTHAHCIQKNPAAAYGRCGCGMYRPQGDAPAGASCTCAPPGDWREEGPQQPDEDCPVHGSPDVMATPTDRAAEAHRLALSEALGLGTGAPWDAIREQANGLQAEIAKLIRWRKEDANAHAEKLRYWQAKLAAVTEGRDNLLHENTQLRADRAADAIDWKAKYEAEHARHVAVVGQLVADPAAVLRGAADDWTAHCPDHTDAEETFMDCPCYSADELRRKANETQQAEPLAADCPYGVGPGDGSGCIKPAGHDGDHVVTAGVTVMPCSPVVRQPHMPHSWRPQPGMAYVHCPGATTEEQL